VCAAFVFYFASRRLAVLTRRPLLCGAAFGVAMYAAMHFIVLPLSRIHFRLPTLHNVIGELFSHVFLFGMVIALGVARASSARGVGATWASGRSSAEDRYGERGHSARRRFRSESRPHQIGAFAASGPDGSGTPAEPGSFSAAD